MAVKKDDRPVGSMAGALLDAVQKAPSNPLASEISERASRGLQHEPPTTTPERGQTGQITIVDELPVVESTGDRPTVAMVDELPHTKKENSVSDNFDNAYTLDDSWGGLSRTLGLASGAVDVSEFKKLAEKILATDPTVNEGPYGKPTFVTLEGSVLGLPCNGLAIVMYAKSTAGVVPMFYTLLMEPEERLVPRQYSVGNYSVDIDTTVGEVYGDDVAKLISAHIAKLTGNAHPGAPAPIDTGANIVPADLNLKDPENEKRIRAILFFALGALNTAFDVRFGNQKFLSLAKSGKQQLLATANWSGRGLETAAGHPIRGDVVLTTAKRPKSVGGQQFQQAVASRPVSALAGFLDLIYAAPVAEPGTHQYAGYGVPANAKLYWFPRFVITRALPMGRTINIGEFLLALASVNVLGINYNWIQGFQPKRGTGTPDMHDIGALGYERDFAGTGQKQRVDTQDSSFSLTGFLTETVHNNLIYSMDIDEAGDMTWLESLLVAMARNDEESVAATNYFIAAADALTGGQFSQKFPKGEAIVLPEVVRVHLGHYPDGDRLVDIRNISYLSILNATGKNGPDLATKWANALVEYPSNNVMSLYDRQTLLKELVPGFKHTGYANRITFNAKALNALGEAVAAAGLTLQYVDTDRAAIGDPRQTVNYAQFGQGNAYTSSLVTAGYGGVAKNQRGIQSPVSGNVWGGVL